MEKKVLFVATVVKTHIMEFHIPFLKMFQEQGWKTAVAAKNDYENPADCVIPYCDTYFDVNFSRSPVRKENISAYRELKKIIDEGSYDIIHCHTPSAAVLARLAARSARKRGTRVLYTAHGFHFYKGAPLKNWLLYFPAEWLASFLTDTIITVNREDYAFARKHLHASEVRYVRGVGVDMNRFGIYGDYRGETRKSLGLNEEDFVLLSVAELTPNKNHEMMLRALAQIPRKNIRLICAGRGETMEKMLALRAQLQLEDRVQFLGYRNDVGKLYAAADAFLFPSFREGLSVSLMEAMASGLPCIVGAIRGNVDLIDRGVQGEYTELTPEGIAQTILRLASDSGLCARYGQEARKKVEQFGADQVHQEMRQIYFGKE